MFGIRNLLLVVEGVAGLGSIAGDIFQDGRPTIADIGSLVKLFPILQSLASVDYKKIADEVKDLDANELNQLQQALVKHFDLPSNLDRVEAQIEKVLEVCFKLSLLVKEVIEMTKKK